MTRRPTHPIRRMLANLDRVYWAGEDPQHEKVARRHTKPLVDALEANHQAVAESVGHPVATCPDCRLIAAWRAPL